MTFTEANIPYALMQVAVMALITYLIRMLPLTLFRKPIKNRYINAFLFYIPYAVLAAMTFPTILNATGNIYSAIAGLLVAAVLAFFERSLLTVALSACGAVFIAELLTRYVFGG